MQVDEIVNQKSELLVLGFDIFVNLRRFFFGGFDLLGLVLDLKLRLVFDFVLTLIFGTVLDGRFVDLDLNIQNELICCVLLSLNENLF